MASLEIFLNIALISNGVHGSTRSVSKSAPSPTPLLLEDKGKGDVCKFSFQQVLIVHCARSVNIAIYYRQRNDGKVYCSKRYKWANQGFELI